MPYEGPRIEPHLGPADAVAPEPDRDLRSEARAPLSNDEPRRGTTLGVALTALAVLGAAAMVVGVFLS